MAYFTGIATLLTKDLAALADNSLSLGEHLLKSPTAATSNDPAESLSKASRGARAAMADVRQKEAPSGQAGGGGPGACGVGGCGLLLLLSFPGYVRALRHKPQHRRLPLLQRD